MVSRLTFWISICKAYKVKNISVSLGLQVFPEIKITNKDSLKGAQISIPYECDKVYMSQTSSSEKSSSRI
jgi:hypothetical protein